MAKFKIQKGLSDAEMMKQWGGDDNFEETMMQAERNAAKPVIHQSPKLKRWKRLSVRCCWILKWSILKKEKGHSLFK